MSGQQSRAAAVNLLDQIKFEILGIDENSQHYIVNMYDINSGYQIGKEAKVSCQDLEEYKHNIDVIATIKNIEEKY